MLEVERLSKRLGDFSISGVSFDVAAGEYFVLLGESGVGKTVLLETITGIVTPDSGRIVLDGRDITNERIQKRGIGLVFQNQSLFPHLSVRNNIAYGMRCRGIDRRAVGERVRRLAEDIEIEAILDRRPDTLSGGEAQRTALARALATGPGCLLLDEPISSLDISARSEMRALLRRLNRDGVTIVHVTHDYEEAVSLANRIGVMEEGRIVQAGSPGSIFKHPKSEFVARFVGLRNFFRGRITGGGEREGVAEFRCGAAAFRILSDARGAEGHAMIRSEDVAIATEAPSTSALNVFEGTVKDISPSRLGVEVVADIGVEITALLTKESVVRLGLRVGSGIYVIIKASAIKFLEI